MLSIPGKFKKQRSYQHDGVMEAVRMSVENLSDQTKERYRELAVFLDDVGIPAKVFSMLSLLTPYYSIIG